RHSIRSCRLALHPRRRLWTWRLDRVRAISICINGKGRKSTPAPWCLTTTPPSKALRCAFQEHAVDGYAIGRAGRKCNLPTVVQGHVTEGDAGHVSARENLRADLFEADNRPVAWEHGAGPTDAVQSLGFRRVIVDRFVNAAVRKRCCGFESDVTGIV